MTFREAFEKAVEKFEAESTWEGLHRFIIRYDEEERDEFDAENIDNLEKQWKKWCEECGFYEDSIDRIKDDGKATMLL